MTPVSCPVRWLNATVPAAQFRRRFFDEDDLPEPIARSLTLATSTRSWCPGQGRGTSSSHRWSICSRRPRSTGSACRPCAVGSGHSSPTTPTLTATYRTTSVSAWRRPGLGPSGRLNSGSRLGAFSKDDPIRLLAHNLNYWVPPVTSVVQETLKTFPERQGQDGRPRSA